MILSILSTVLLAGSTPTAAFTDESPAKERKICKRQGETGSLIVKKKVCKTRSEWDAMAQNARDTVEKIQDGSRTPPAT